MSSDQDNDRYREAKRIANEALDHPREDRDAFVAECCGDDKALIDEVRWLIEAAEDATADEVPESFQAAAQQTLRQVSLEVPLPRNYRLVRRLDAGGMGVVYLAERNDEAIHQQVALKLLQLTEAPDEALKRRFATERQILSRLDHPNIARLIDGGLTAEGRPFMATEFVDGQPIDAWCRTHGGSLDARLRLFLKVCDAVDYAHRHMVIHRDIKPPNILVTSEGEPKLLDFGIARLLDAKDSAEPAQEVPDDAMTLAYASPEQIRAEGLSAATDVYSLGVVLYELLTGARPFDPISEPRELRSAILEGEIRTPSRANGERPWQGSQDLEAIILKALERQPEQRYTTVRDLAEDVQRYLEHQPVAARSGGMVYRASRFVRRHRLGAMVSLGIVAMLIAFLVDRESQLQRIAFERDRAEAVTEFMNDLFAGADSLPSRGNEVTVREILDLGTEKLATDDEFNPVMLGSIYLAIAQAYNALGLGEQALPLLHQARQALLPSIGTAEEAMIQAEIGAALDSAGRAIEAIEADEQAIALYESAGPGFTEELLALQIRKLRNHANVLDVPLERTIVNLNAIIERIDGLPDPPGELRFEAHAALVGAYVFSGQAQQAMQTATLARTQAESLYDEGDPRRLRGRYVFATAMMLNDPETAVAMYESLIADHERLIGPSQRLANTIGNFGVALSRIGRNERSMAAFAEAADMIEEVAGRDHYLYRLSVSNLAALHLRQSQPEQAERLVRDILADQDRRFSSFEGVEAVYRASALDILGSALTLQDRLEEAAAVYRQAVALLDTEPTRASPAMRDDLEEKLQAVTDQLSTRSSSG